MSIRAMIVAALATSTLWSAPSFGQYGQQPAAPPPAQSTPPTLPSPDPKRAPDAEASSGHPAATSRDRRIFMGTVVQEKDAYVLRAANLEYRLDDRSKVQEFRGKNVKITGRLDQGSNTIHVDTIEASPSM